MYSGADVRFLGEAVTGRQGILQSPEGGVSTLSLGRDSFGCDIPGRTQGILETLPNS